MLTNIPRRSRYRAMSAARGASARNQPEVFEVEEKKVDLAPGPGAVIVVAAVCAPGEIGRLIIAAYLVLVGSGREVAETA